MDISQSNWSESDDSNNSAAPDGAPEGMPPSGVNNTMRAMMGAIKRWYDQQIPATTGGTSTAYTLTYTVSPGALADGMTFLVNFNAACGASPTLNVNTLGAKGLQKYSGGSWVDLAAGDILADQLLKVTYNDSSGKFRVITPLNSVPVGASIGFRGTSDQIPPGWVLEDGGTIGDASSGGTNRASSDCEALFKFLWANSNYSVQDSSGSSTTKGASADADWTAHKRLILIDMSARYRRGADDAGGATGGSTSLQSGTTSGSLTVSGNCTGTTNTESGDANVGGSGTVVAGLNHTHGFSGSINGSTSGSLSVSGTVTSPYVSELSIIKL